MRYSIYLPHVTVGACNAPYATRKLSGILRARRIVETLEFVVPSIDLISYDARDVAGELRLEERITLGYKQSQGG